VSREGSWRHGGNGLLARWTLESADRRQTLSPLLLQELADGAREAANRGARVVVVDSAITRVFAAGAPLEMIRSLNSNAAWEFSRTGQRALDALSGVPAWIVAEIEGACVGGGLDLALACDLRIVSSDATFAHPGVRLGIVTGWGGTFRARRLIAVGGSRRLFERGDVISAEDAFELGLADEVVPSPEFRHRCEGIERELARGFLARDFKVKR
jgi:enoyl-CoA hydratase